MAENFNIVPIILVIVLIIALVAVYFLFIKGAYLTGKSPAASNAVSSHTTSQITSTILQGQGSTTVGTNALAAQLATINITAINLEWYYTGPASIQNAVCGGADFKSEPGNYYYSSFYWGGGHTGGGAAPPVEPAIGYNTTSNVSFGAVLYSGKHCSITVTAINTSTPGFNVTMRVPSTPFSIQQNSSAEVLFTVEFPQHNFKGPLSINFYETGKAAT